MRTRRLLLVIAANIDLNERIGHRDSGQLRYRRMRDCRVLTLQIAPNVLQMQLLCACVVRCD